MANRALCFVLHVLYLPLDPIISTVFIVLHEYTIPLVVYDNHGICLY